jgi:hypothetical protein
MKKKLLMVSMVALGASPLTHAALQLEDDPREVARPVVGDHLYGALEDRVEADRISRFEKEIAEDQARKEAGVLVMDEPTPRVTRSLRDVIDLPHRNVIQWLYRIADEDGLEKTERRELPRQEKTTYTHDDTNHFSIPTIQVYGVTEEGETLNAGGPREGEPLRHTFVSLVSDNPIGDSWSEDGMRKTRKQKTVKYRRVGVDDVEYTVVEDPRIEERPLTPPPAPVAAPAATTQGGGGGGPRRGLFGIGRAW